MVCHNVTGGHEMVNMKVSANLVALSLEHGDFITANMAIGDVYSALQDIVRGASAKDMREATQGIIDKLHLLMSKARELPEPHKTFHYIMSNFTSEWLIPYLASPVGTLRLKP
jgi:hypothetical protein